MRGPIAAATALGIEAVVAQRDIDRDRTPPAWETASNVATNVIAGTITSSPGWSPAAVSPA